MNQDPTVDNDLQKAIDDITKNTNTDPVFGDPVAAPAPQPIAAPRPAPMPKRPMMPPMPRPVAAPRAPLPPRPVAPKPITPAPVAPAPVAAMPPMPEPVVEEQVVSETVTESTIAPDLRELKEAALRDLAPLVEKIDMDPSKKFNLYRDIHDQLHDNSVIAPAYESAKNIIDDHERADALLYLIDSIDNM